MAAAIVSGIYKIENTVNGKCYVGSAVNIYQRWAYHKSDLKKGAHHSGKLQNAWHKYGDELFVFEMLEYVTDKMLLITAEQKWIDKFDSCANGYNIVPIAGSCIGTVRSDEFKAKVSKGMLGRVVSAETRAKISAGNKGNKLPPRKLEDIESRAAALRGKKRPPAVGAAISAARLGMKFSDAHKLNMSLSRKKLGAPIIPAEARAIGDAKRRGAKRTPEQCARIKTGVDAAIARKRAEQAATT